MSALVANPVVVIVNLTVSPSFTVSRFETTVAVMGMASLLTSTSIILVPKLFSPLKSQV